MLDRTPTFSLRTGRMRKTPANKKPPSAGFPTRLKQLRIQKNLSQAELAELAGISGIHVSRYERGISAPSADKLRRLAEIFEVSGDYLFNGAEEGAARVSLANREVLELFKEVEGLPAAEREYVLRVLRDLLTTRRIRAMAAQ